MEVAIFFLECVRNEGATDQTVVDDKKSRNTDSILPDNLSIRAEKIVWSRPDYFPFAFFMPSISPFFPMQLEMVVHILQSRDCQDVGYLYIPIRLERFEIDIEISD